MCGRFTRSSPPQAIAEELGVDVPAELVAAPRFNVCPTEEVLVVARGAEAPALGWMRWGLVPWFARDAKAGPRSINARAETVATNRTFREPFQRRRCLVVADGFYEWRQIGSARQPYFIRLRSRRPFAFAAVWDRWKPPAHPRVGPDGRPDSPHGYKGDPVLSCAIVTCAPNPLVAPIHDRMPVIVPAATRAEWLASDASPAALAAMLRPYPAAEMEAFPVSKLVNSVKNDEPECIRPVEPPAA
jgi:putative SOS response-associated peptidase YedK